MNEFVWIARILLQPFILTVLTEGIMALCLFHSMEIVYASFLCNLMTNPALNLLLVLVTSLAGPNAYYPLLFVLEVLAVCAEGGLYRMLCQWNTARAMKISLLFNAVSVLSGFLVLK